MSEFDLSIVATSRNDDHGGNLHYRMQQFVNGIIKQCAKNQDFKVELILVEWNPPENKEPLAKVLDFEKESENLQIRIVTVPKDAHHSIDNSDKFPLFQMIAKNVGIRRARGKFVLATNIDILFSDKLMQNLKDKLISGYLYRVDRLDVPSKLPDGSFDEILDYCNRNYFRINGRHGTKVKINEKWTPSKLDFIKGMRQLKKPKLPKLWKVWKVWKIQKVWQITYNSVKLFAQEIVDIHKKVQRRFFFNLHTNACGDFTLLSYKDWEDLKGYPEMPYFSWHLDSLFLYQAKISGIEQEIFPKEAKIYHIEHGLGSGYTEENPEPLFDRLKKNKIPYISDHELENMIYEMRKKSARVHYNDDSWGLKDLDLEEVSF